MVGASVHGHSPFGADSAPGGEPPLPPSALVAPGGETPLSRRRWWCARWRKHLQKSIRTCSHFHKIAPSEPEVRITVAPIVVLAVDHDSETWTHSGEGSVHSCMRRRLGGKISDSQEKESLPSAGSCAVDPSIRSCSSPCQRRPPSSSRASDPSMRGLEMPPHSDIDTRRHPVRRIF